MATTNTDQKDDPYPTRSSLLRRIQDPQDERSWQEFYKVYSKLVFNFGLKAGLTNDEAEELVQETMITAARHLPQFRYDPKVCSFKTWLLNLSRWRVVDQLRRRRTPWAPQAGSAHATAGDSSGTRTIEGVPDPSGGRLEAIWDEEWRTTLLDAALARIKARVDPRRWQIFEVCALKDWSVKEVAEAFGVSAGRVYLTKHRVSLLLKQELKKLERT